VIVSRAAFVIVALTLAGCGAASTATTTGGRTTAPTSSVPHARPQAIEPVAGQHAAVAGGDTTPVGDPHAHAPPLSQVRSELRLEVIATRVTSAKYINPLPFVTCCGHWERTDQGVDASMPVGAPIVAPCRIKVLAIEPDWYAGQPLVYYELLEGPDAGKVQYVSEQITDIATPGSFLQQGQVVARFAPSGTGIEFGWSTLNGVTLAMATTGYEEGQVTPAGLSIRAWLNAVGANAGSG
jgi:hypothetical protein